MTTEELRRLDELRLKAQKRHNEDCQESAKAYADARLKVEVLSIERTKVWERLNQLDHERLDARNHLDAMEKRLLETAAKCW